MKTTPILETLGAPTPLSSSAVVPSSPAQSSLSCDLANGPVDTQHIWVLEYASMNYVDLAGNALQPLLCGLYIVPVNSNPVLDPADVGTTLADFVDRGIALPVIVDPIISSYTTLEVALSQRGFVVPYGYTLRAVVCGSGTAANKVLAPGSQLMLQAMVRVINICGC